MEIKNYHPMDSGALRGIFDLTIPKWANVTIKGMKIFQKGNQRWTAFPSDRVEKDGETKYYPRLFFEDPEMKKTFQSSLVEALDKHIASLPEETPDEEIPEDMPF